MKLYSGPLSLFSRKAEIALHEKGLGFQRVMVPFTQTEGYSPKHPEVLAFNPKGQVPVLVDGDLVIYDSTVILEYLEDAYPDPPLYPVTSAGRARCRLHELYADEVMLPPLRSLMHRTSPSNRESWEAGEAKAKAAEPVLKGQLQALDRSLHGRRYLCDALSVADIATFMTVFYCQRLGGPTLDEYRALLSWFENLLHRRAFAQVASEIMAADEELSQPVEGAFGGRKPVLGTSLEVDSNSSS
jgi:glutathione S-transferase